MQLSLVIPCYNESSRIHLMMDGLKEFDAKFNQPYEVIIVDDGSKDDSVAKMEALLTSEFSGLKSKITIISQANSGKGGALQTGVSKASGSYVLTLDTDMSARPTQILEWMKLEKNLFKKNEIFIGNRTDKRSKIEAEALRKFTGSIFNFIVQLLTPLNVNDTQCGFKLYPTPLAKAIFGQMKTTGWAHDVEVLFKAHLLGIKINEMPLEWKNIDNSKVNVWTDSIKMLVQVLIMSLRVRFTEVFISPFGKPAENLEGSSNEKYFRLAFWCLAILVLFAMPKLSFDFGVTGDEHWHHDYGNAIYHYYFNGDHSVADWQRVENSKKFEESGIHYYGGMFDLWVAIWNKKVGAWGDYEMQHFWISVVGAIGIITTGLLAAEMGGWLLALLALLIMALSPSYLGHCFNNPKDIPFATASVFAVYQLIKFLKQLQKPSLKTSILLALGIGAALGVRIGGLLLIIYMWMFVLSYSFIQKDLKGSLNSSLLIRLFFISLGGYALGIICWPFALESPISRPIETLQVMSNFFTKLPMLFNGERISNDEVPWNYIPTWISITAPIIFLIGILGAPVILFLSRKKYNLFFAGILLFVSLFPWLYAVKKNSALYDGWRHFLFIYPTLVVLAAITWHYLFSLVKGNLKWAVAMVVGALLFLPAKFMAKSHPNEYLYFNEYFGGIKNAYGNFETDFWMNSSKEAFNWLVEHEKLNDRTDSFSIRTNCVDPVSYYALEFNSKGKPVHYDLKNGAAPDYGIKFPAKTMFVGYANYKNRMNMEDWDYGIFYTRFIEKELLEQPGYFPPAGTIYTVMMDDVPLMCVVKRNSRLEKKYIAQAEDLLKRNQIDSALLMAQKALAIYPENAKAIRTAWQCYSTKQQFSQAIPMLTIGLRGNPMSDEYYYYMGVCYAYNRDKSNAVAYLSMALQLNPQLEQAKQMLQQIQGR